jgi:hypothetical protein
MIPIIFASPVAVANQQAQANTSSQNQSPSQPGPSSSSSQSPPSTNSTSGSTSTVCSAPSDREAFAKMDTTVTLAPRLNLLDPSLFLYFLLHRFHPWLPYSMLLSLHVSLSLIKNISNERIQERQLHKLLPQSHSNL